MSRRVRKDGDLVLYTCPHHVYGDKYSIDILMTDDCIAIKCYDTQYPRHKSWLEPVSVCLVAGMVQTYYYNLQILWDLLARSMIFIGDDMKCSTQHIVYFPIKLTIERREAYLIYEYSHTVADAVQWHVQFLCECAPPFILELHIVREQYLYHYRIQAEHLMGYFHKYCLAAYDSEPPVDAPEPSKLTRSLMFDAVCKELFYDEEADQFIVKFVEFYNIETFLNDSRERYSQLKSIRRNHSDDAVSDGSADNAFPDYHAFDDDGEYSDGEDSAAAGRRRQAGRGRVDRARADRPKKFLLAKAVHSAKDVRDIDLSTAQHVGIGDAIEGTTDDVESDVFGIDDDDMGDRHDDNSLDNRMDHSSRYDDFNDSSVEDFHRNELTAIESVVTSADAIHLDTLSFIAPPPVAPPPDAPLSLSELLAPRKVPTDSIKDRISKRLKRGLVVVKKDNAKDIIGQMWLENSEIISHQNREAAIGLVDMHMKKYSRVSASAFVRNTETELLIVREALTVRPEYRSRSSTAKIVEMLRLGCKLSPLLINCSDFDLLSIANSAVLEDIELSDFQSTLIVNRGDPILSIYIILQGVLEVAVVDEAPPAANGVSQGEQQPFDESAVKIDPPVASLEASTLRKRYLKIGDCIGEALMEGQVSWAADVSAVHTKKSRGRREVLSLCSLPAASVLKHLGRKGSDVEGIMVLFWKYCRVWGLINRFNHEELLRSMYKRSAKQDEAELIQEPQTMELVESTRLRTFQPGVDIFKQATPRHYLYIVLQGCCEYRRCFPTDVVRAGIAPEYISLQAILMCGDYSFMEGDDVAFYKQMSIADQVLELSSIGESKQVKEARKKKYHQFGLHKNSLVSLTRVEVAVVPLLEISKCFVLFVTLIRQATAKYPITFTSNEEVIRKYHEEEHWKTDRVQVMRNLVLQNNERTLSEYWNQSYGIGNNVSDKFYKSHQPGGKVSNILRVAELTKTARELQTTRDDGVPSGSERAFSRGSIYSPTHTAGSLGSDGRNRQQMFSVGPSSPNYFTQKLSSNANALSANSHHEPVFDQMAAVRRTLMSQVMLSSNQANSARGSCHVTGPVTTDNFSSANTDRSKLHSTVYKQRNKASRDADTHQRTQPIDDVADYTSTKSSIRGNRDAEQEQLTMPAFQPRQPPPRVRPSTSYVGSNRNLRSRLSRHDRQRPYSAVDPSGGDDFSSPFAAAEEEEEEEDWKPSKQLFAGHGTEEKLSPYPSLHVDTHSRQERGFDTVSSTSKSSSLRHSRDFSALKSDDFVKLYQESVLNDPKTRFLQEFIIKDHLNVPNK